ncbi:hypothetical protein ACHAQC_005238 [Fusarium culmorum]
MTFGEDSRLQGSGGDESGALKARKACMNHADDVVEQVYLVSLCQEQTQLSYHSYLSRWI